MKKKRKWIKWAVIVLVLALAASWFAYASQQTRSAVYTQVPVTTGDLTTVYNFDGLVYARSMQTLTAAQADTVSKVYVQQNQQVKKGERLYKLENGGTVEAGMRGEITAMNIQPDDVLNAGDVTVEIIDMDRLEVRLNVDEYDVAAIEVGKEVQIELLATGTSYTGTVRSLSKNGTASGDLSYYTAYIDLPDTTGIYPGMQVSAKMLRGQALSATLVRMDAIQFDETNKPYVLMNDANGKDVVEVPVTVGISDGLYCEILDGVRAGETVLKPSGMNMAEIMQMMRARQ